MYPGLLRLPSHCLITLPGFGRKLCFCYSGHPVPGPQVLHLCLDLYLGGRNAPHGQPVFCEPPNQSSAPLPSEKTVVSKLTGAQPPRSRGSKWGCSRVLLCGEGVKSILAVSSLGQSCWNRLPALLSGPVEQRPALPGSCTHRAVTEKVMLDQAPSPPRPLIAKPSFLTLDDSPLLACKLSSKEVRQRQSRLPIFVLWPIS